MRLTSCCGRGGVAAVLAAALVLASVVGGDESRAACCYFSAKDKDVLQPAQKAFITWDPEKQVESFTVQPQFFGDARDFGMVIPTPSRPKLDEMPRDFFSALATFTILEPTDATKYRPAPGWGRRRGGGGGGAGLFDSDGGGDPDPRLSVRVFEAGIVGSLDYKVLQARKGRADDLFEWLKDNGYSYDGDEKTLDHYVRKGWFFTVMKIDPTQIKQSIEGRFVGDVTPTRFTFDSEKLVYPLRITRISVRDATEAVFYVQAPQKMNLPREFSYQSSFVPMWSVATEYAVPEKLTPAEVAWQKHVKPLRKIGVRHVRYERKRGREAATLEWAKKITGNDVAVLAGEREFSRGDNARVPAAEVAKLRILKGHVKQGQWVTKMRKIFTRAEMDEDLEFVRAQVYGKDDDIEYFASMSTSPP